MKLSKRQRHKQQRQIWRRRMEQDKLVERYEHIPIYPQRETYTPWSTLI